MYKRQELEAVTDVLAPAMPKMPSSAAVSVTVASGQAGPDYSLPPPAKAPEPPKEGSGPLGSVRALELQLQLRKLEIEEGERHRHFKLQQEAQQHQWEAQERTKEREKEEKHRHWEAQERAKEREDQAKERDKEREFELRRLSLIHI